MLKNITLSAEHYLIDGARKKATHEKKSLNEYKKLMRKLSYVAPGKKFSREEMNER